MTNCIPHYAKKKQIINRHHPCGIRLHRRRNGLTGPGRKDVKIRRRGLKNGRRATDGYNSSCNYRLPAHEAANLPSTGDKQKLPINRLGVTSRGMLIRFATLAKDPDSGHTRGVLVAAHSLRDEGPLSGDEHEELRLLLSWFTDNLPVPKVLADSEHRRAISWFKPNANEAIRKMWELRHLLGLHGYHVNVLRTNEPGSILYEDEWQVVAKPPKGVRY